MAEAEPPEATPSPTLDVAPVPVSATVCGLLGALSVIVRVPARAPAAVGVKVTKIWQVANALIAAPQLLVSAKSPVA